MRLTCKVQDFHLCWFLDERNDGIEATEYSVPEPLSARPIATEYNLALQISLGRVGNLAGIIQLAVAHTAAVILSAK